MPTIADRVYLGAFNLRNVDNIRSHHRQAALLCAKMSRAVYAIKDELNPQGVKWIPSQSLREHFAAEGPESAIDPKASSLAASFSTPPDGERRDRDERGEMRAFTVSVPGGIALGVSDHETIIVAFRGTQGAQDWGINLFGLTAAGPQVVDCGVDRHTQGFLHAGFASIAAALSRAIEEPLHKLLKHTNNDSARILYCGHSLGGALALLAALPIETRVGESYYFDGRPEAIYTFGAPKIGDRNVARLMFRTFFRYVLRGDPVPKVPIGEFAHHMPAIEIDPYLIFQNPGPLGKATVGVIKAQQQAKNLAGVGAAVSTELLATEHDIDLYIDVVDALSGGNPTRRRRKS